MTAAVSHGPRASPPRLRLVLRPELPRPNLAAARALMLACLAVLWIAGASAATAAVILAVHPSVGKGRLLIDALVAASFRAILVAELLSKVVFLLLLRAALRFPGSVLQARGLKLRRMLHETAWLDYVVALVFVIVGLAGCLVVVELSEGSRVGTTRTLIIDAVVVASAATACLDILPKMALKLWRMKPAGGAMPIGCTV